MGPDRKRSGTGQLILAAYALIGTEVLSWVLSLILNALRLDVSPLWFVLFGALTMPMVMSWLAQDSARAYAMAVSQRFLGFEGEPPRIVSVSNECPKRWLVLLYIRMHPELIRKKT
jgi:hypothetical protein